ncbi:hypothetical protein FRC00_001076 [Tulasnella sp. 408]|nr:hypothetical protein FRC00_001076 [Tulasnella sp. 408]
MRHRRPTPVRDTAPERLPRRHSTDSGGDRRGRDDARSFRSRRSSHGSVDSAFIERFSASDGVSDPSMRGLQSSASDAEKNENSNPIRGWMRGGAGRALRSVTKRKASKLLNELIKASTRTGRNTAGRRERSRASWGLIDIIKREPDGEDIVARRFVKKASRQEWGIRALLRLSDDELDELGYDALSPGSKEIASTKLLGTVVQHTSEAQLFRSTISDWLRDDERGVAAILYLATTEPGSFCANIDDQILLNFCKRVVASEERLSPKWYCGAKLFCILLMHKPLWWRNEQPTVELLSSVGKVIFHETIVEIRRNFPEDSPSLLPLIAVCCATIRINRWWSALPQEDTMSVLARRLISFLHSESEDIQIFNTSQAYALSTLLSLLESATIANIIPEFALYRLGVILMKVALKKRFLDIGGSDLFAKNILKPLDSSLDQRCIEGLSRVPESVFTEALKSALNDGIPRLNNLNLANSYEPLDLAERLLWLSNMKLDTSDRDYTVSVLSRGGVVLMERMPRSSTTKPSAGSSVQIHRVLVNGNACRFLAKVVSHSGNLDAQDRGLWRAKGLAMTCLGNIIELMNTRQLRDHITPDIIDAVATIREHDDVPELPKGQAILLLKRYTWAANSRGIRPFYSEDTSNLADEFKRIGLHDGR